jgi:hypothetical protein
MVHQYRVVVEEVLVGVQTMGRNKRFPHPKNLLEAGVVQAVAVEEAGWMPLGGSYSKQNPNRLLLG